MNDMKLEADHLILMEDGIISKQDKLKDGVNIKTINGISLLGAGDISIKNGSLVDSSLIIFTENIDNWERKTISSTGVESTTSITQSNIMHKTKFTGVVYLVPKGDITYALVTYNNDGTFKARSSWYSENNGTKMLTDSNPFNIVVATGASDTNITISELLARFTLQNMDPKDIQEEESSAVNPENIAKINSKLKYLNFIQSCDIAEKMVHFSCDDTYNCLYDLTKNANKYTSIFDNSFFKSLQTCHNSTGACFTLNTFNTQTTVSDYNISNVPTKF